MKDLLFILADYPFKEANRQVLSDNLKKVVDWEKLVRLVNDHGIIALARYNIKEAGLEKLITPGVMARLENGYLQSVVRNSWLSERWMSVNEILCNADIKHILLKGMALEHTIYGSKGLRQMSDNDILVKREEALKAWNLLQKDGFVANPLKSSLHYKIILDIGKHLPALVKNGYVIEIHTRLLNDIKIDDNIFANANEILVNNTRAYIPVNEIHKKYLINHFMDHVFKGECQLRNYSDIKILDPENPLEFPSEFIDNPSQKIKLKFRKEYFRSSVKVVPSMHRLRYIVGDTFPSVSWMKKRHGCSGARTMLYYPRRILKLAWLI